MAVEQVLNSFANCATLIFYGLFYGRAKFRRKTAQFTATLRERWIAETPSVSNAVQRSDNEYKGFARIMSPVLCR